MIAGTSPAIGAGALVAGKYRLEAPLGQGGMGVVWRARHVLLEQPTALKLLEVQDSDPAAAVDRFLREGRAAAAVRHPNVVEIRDLGLLESGTPYLAMELLEGWSLREQLERGPALTVGELIAMLTAVLDGLAAVHDAGLIHRDVKPDNIFVCDGPGGRVPKLLDFGLSRRADPDALTITQQGSIIGTPIYMAPEQARGRSWLDGRTDLYSVSVVLYEALTGTPPFLADNTADLIIAILTADVPPLHRVRPELGAKLSVAVHRAMERDPEARFASARVMIGELQAALELEPHLADVPLPEPCGRRRSAEASSEAGAPRSLPAGIPSPLGHAAAGDRARGATIALEAPPPSRTVVMPALPSLRPRPKPRRPLLVGAAAVLLLACGWLALRDPSTAESTPEVAPGPPLARAPVRAPALAAAPDESPTRTALEPEPESEREAPGADARPEPRDHASAKVGAVPQARAAAEKKTDAAPAAQRSQTRQAKRQRVRPAKHRLATQLDF